MFQVEKLKRERALQNLQNINAAPGPNSAAPISVWRCSVQSGSSSSNAYSPADYSGLSNPSSIPSPTAGPTEQSPLGNLGSALDNVFIHSGYSSGTDSSPPTLPNGSAYHSEGGARTVPSSTYHCESMVKTAPNSAYQCEGGAKTVPNCSIENELMGVNSVRGAEPAVLMDSSSHKSTLDHGNGCGTSERGNSSSTHPVTQSPDTTTTTLNSKAYPPQHHHHYIECSGKLFGVEHGIPVATDNRHSLLQVFDQYKKPAAAVGDMLDSDDISQALAAFEQPTASPSFSQ